MPLINYMIILMVFGYTLPSKSRAQTALGSREASISFFSQAPLEDIDAKSTRVISSLDTHTGEIRFEVPIRSFIFKNKRMQEHFNENFLESDRYPTATFKGHYQGDIHTGRNGSYAVTVTGGLTLHGIGKTYSVPAVLRVSGQVITAAATFKIALADHKIRIPRLLTRNIAEVVEVQVMATYPLQDNNKTTP